MLKVADNEKKNVNFPASVISQNITKKEVRPVFTFRKINPTKNDWGDITIEVDVKEPKTR